LKEPQSMVMEIMGRPLTIKSSMPAEKLEELAGLVNQQLDQLQKAFPSSPLADLAILAALNFASDYLESKEEFQQLRQEIEHKSKSLIQRLEKHGISSPAGA
jgi:cell division protein ZapA (FtsZ GTPase activity inhibitor)